MSLWVLVISESWVRKMEESHAKPWTRPCLKDWPSASGDIPAGVRLLQWSPSPLQVPACRCENPTVLTVGGFKGSVWAVSLKKPEDIVSVRVAISFVGCGRDIRKEGWLIHIAYFNQGWNYWAAQSAAFSFFLKIRHIGYVKTKRKEQKKCRQY